MTQSPSVLIIGAGLGGLGVAAHLARAGHHQVRILERADSLGGVWRDNTYPGAACDVPSSLYSWSFAPNPDWQRRYGTQPDILGYLEREADRLGLRERIHTGQQVVSATWEADRAQWRVVTTDGSAYTADVLVPATGQLSDPVVPALPGVDTFAGPAFHSARWRHDVDLTGRRVGVIGTGASAIQFVPAVVDRVASLTIHQRSAPYVVPKPDRAYTRSHHAAYRRMPRTQAFGRGLTWHLSEWLNGAFEKGGILPTLLRATWRAHLRATVKEPGKRAQLVPDHPIGCKRLLFSNDWYPAVNRDHVTLVSEQIAAVEPTGVRTADGALHEADVLVWGTGFAATDFLGEITVRGVDGTSLADAWSGGARAHLGMTVPGFPNLFWVYGPHTNLGGGSIVSMMEAQARYVAHAAGHLADALARGERITLDVRPEVADAFDTEMQRRLGNSVWNNCASWYRTGGGRITTNWPGTVTEYRRRTRELALTDFTVTTAIGASA